MNKLITATSLFILLLSGCSNMRDATIAHDHTNKAKEGVDKHLEEIKSYINTDEKISISLAVQPDPNDFLNEPVSIKFPVLNYINLTQILPGELNRDVRFSNDLIMPESQSDEPLTLNYSGTMSGLLNSICFQLNCSWSVTQDRSIYISRYQTKFWRIPLLPINRMSKTSISSENVYGADNNTGGGNSGETLTGGTGGQSSFGGESGQSVSSEFEYKAIDTIKSIIEPLLSDVESTNSSSGEKWSYSTQTGLLSVTASNHKIAAIDVALENLSKYLTSQVVFNIKIISYEENETESYGIDWNVLWERIGEFGISADIGTNVDAASDQIGFSVIESGQPFTGSSAFINALSEFATITSSRDLNYFTLSNQVLPFHIAEEIPFNVVEQTLVPDVGVTQSFTLFTKSIGLHMNLLPVILSEDELMMEFKYSLSSLSDFLEIDLGTNGSARIPQTKVNEAMQQVKIRNGESVVLSGFTIDDAVITKRSPVKSKAWFLGGSKNEEWTKSSVVIVVTPQIKI